jgi:hypothetical protein
MSLLSGMTPCPLTSTSFTFADQQSSFSQSSNRAVYIFIIALPYAAFLTFALFLSSVTPGTLLISLNVFFLLYLYTYSLLIFRPLSSIASEAVETCKQVRTSGNWHLVCVFVTAGGLMGSRMEDIRPEGSLWPWLTLGGYEWVSVMILNTSKYAASASLRSSTLPYFMHRARN